MAKDLISKLPPKLIIIIDSTRFRKYAISKLGIYCLNLLLSSYLIRGISVLSDTLI